MKFLCPICGREYEEDFSLELTKEEKEVINNFFNEYMKPILEDVGIRNSEKLRERVLDACKDFKRWSLKWSLIEMRLFGTILCPICRVPCIPKREVRG